MCICLICGENYGRFGCSADECLGHIASEYSFDGMFAIARLSANNVVDIVTRKGASAREIITTRKQQDLLVKKDREWVQIRPWDEPCRPATDQQCDIKIRFSIAHMKEHDRTIKSIEYEMMQRILDRKSRMDTEDILGIEATCHRCRKPYRKSGCDLYTCFDEIEVGMRVYRLSKIPNSVRKHVIEAHMAWKKIEEGRR